MPEVMDSWKTAPVMPRAGAGTTLETALGNSTSAGTLLANFSGWANGGSGFTNAFDLGQVWVERDIASASGSSTVGVAYTPGICSENSRFAIFENFSTTAWALRVLTSHETGHNLSLTHDAAGSSTIMAPSINNTTAWSAQSVAQFENHVSSPPCLDGTFALTGSPKLVYYVPEQICVGQVITVENNSGRMPGPYTWTFTNGTPANSNDADPTVTFPTAGTETISVASANAVCGAPVTVTESSTVNIISETGPAAACTPAGNNTATTDNFGIGIRRFTAGTIANATGDAGQSGRSYSDYTCQFFDSNADDNVIPITVDLFNANTQTVEVYVDLNNDGNFTTDEELFSQTVTGVGSAPATVVTINGSLAIPATVTKGQILRTRVLAVFNTSGPGVGGCTNSSLQEVEDYGLRFPSTLPVEVVSFDATEKAGDVALKWTVADEVALYGYDVAHSTDGQEWDVIGSVEARGVGTYDLIHPDVRPGTHYYQLTSIDDDGSTQSTAPIAIRVFSTRTELSVEPNPVAGGTASFSLVGWGAGQPIDVKVFDLRGRQLAFAKTHPDVDGNADLHMDLNHLPAGMYLVRANDGEVERHRSIVVR